MNYKHMFTILVVSLAFISCSSINLNSITKQDNLITDRNSKIVAIYDTTVQKYHYPYKQIASQTLISVAQTTKKKNISLTIDIELQKYIATLFSNLSASAVVMSTKGEILSISSFPEYDINIFTDGISKKKWKLLLADTKKPFINKNINALYTPGLTIAPVLGLHYISSHLGKDFYTHCQSSFMVGKHNFKCSTKHAKTDVTKAIREGCSDYFYKGSIKLGISDISQTLKRYGLGRPTNVDISREFHGLVPSKEWKTKKYGKPWYIGETLTTSIGQGNLLVTPLQITQLTALIATGKLPTPYIMLKKKENIKVVLNAKELQNLHIIQRAMFKVFNNQKGESISHITSKVMIAGEKGFSQTIKDKPHSWIITYAPYKNPQYVVTVLIENDSSNGSKNIEIVSKIYNKLLELNYLNLETN